MTMIRRKVGGEMHLTAREVAEVLSDRVKDTLEGVGLPGYDEKLQMIIDQLLDYKPRFTRMEDIDTLPQIPSRIPGSFIETLPQTSSRIPGSFIEKPKVGPSDLVRPF